MTAPHDEEPAETDVDRGVPAAEPAPSGGKGGFGWLIEIVETLVLTLVIFLVIQNFIAQPFEVQGPSMETTFLDGQYVLVDRISHNWAPYAHGQVVVFNPPPDVDERGYPFIKRVIGVPGDTVELRDGKVFVNGTAIDEPYLFRDEDGTVGPTEPSSDQTTWTVEPGMLFVMGDHREVSEDGRYFGPIPQSSVIGRAIFRYWPLSAFGLIQTP
ncbi:MAG: signal peptidase I [Chloroflexota bacterium]